MSKLIAICRGLREPETPDCVEDEAAEKAAVLAPCQVISDTCRLTTGDAVLEEEKSRADQDETILEDGCCEC